MTVNKLEIKRARSTPVVAALVAITLAIAGCSTATIAGASQPTTAASTTSAKYQAILTKGYKGDFQPAPISGPKAQTGKKVWWISCGQAYAACSTMSTEFAAAGKALGWSVTVQDGNATATTAASLIRSAISAKVNAIGLATYDCPTIKSALLEAKAAKIPVVNFGSIDCNDPVYNDPSAKALFTATVKLRGSNRALNFETAWAKARAEYVIAKTNGKANVLNVAEQSQVLQKTNGEAFTQEMKTCAGCTVTQVPFTFAQVPNPATQQFQTAIQAHPDATVVAEGLDSIMGLGLQTAVSSSGRHGLIVGGGEGFANNFDLIRQNVQTFSVALSYGWMMYALADTLNRVFAGQNPAAFPNEGGGWQYVDKGHNLPPKGQAYDAPVNYRAAYTKIWMGK
jgi:ribose transport system substrate-binding protein